MSINVGTFSGNLGSDPEAKFFESGKSVTEFNIAIKRIGNDKPMWLKVKAWGKPGEFAASYLRKGSYAIVSGRLDEETWQDRESGKERSRYVLVCDRVESPKSSQEASGKPEDYDEVF